MAYIVDLSPETREPLEAEAQRIGMAPADFIAGIMAQRYGVARNAAYQEFPDDFADMTPEEARASLTGPTVTLAESNARAMANLRAHAPEMDWNAWDAMTDVEKDAEVQRSIAEMPANVRAEMEQEGLL